MDEPQTQEYTAHIKELYLRGDLSDEDMKTVLDAALDEWEADYDEWFRQELMKTVLEAANRSHTYYPTD